MGAIRQLRGIFNLDFGSVALDSGIDIRHASPLIE